MDATDVRTVPGSNGLPRIELASGGARADVYLHGAQVTSWIPAGESEDRLFLSARSAFRAGAAIRGGIPVSFPQFANQGALPNHGFLRTLAWEPVALDRLTDGPHSLMLQTRDSEATRALWPRSFRVTLGVGLAPRFLRVSLSVTNTGAEPFDFTAALHAYFRVLEMPRVVVRGLHGLRYRDKVLGLDDVLESERELRVDRALDRVYGDARGLIALREGPKELQIHASGFPDVVVWNPGAGASKLADLEPGDEMRFVCVEAAAARHPLTVAPGQSWFGSQLLVAP